MPTLKFETAIDLLATRIALKWPDDRDPRGHEQPMQYILQQTTSLLRLATGGEVVKLR
ncbi:MAG: hypothetical protein M3178_02830 [Pseudomonadota bacterium]|nr:hypothetical protein [Pseudomonadota bacterium]